MGRLHFYVIWSLRDAPRQFVSKSSRRCFQVHVPLPLPKHLVIFGLGEWSGLEASISADVVVSADLPAYNIGTLSPHTRCLTWEEDWSPDIVAVASERGRRGIYGKIILTVFAVPQEDGGIFSCTRLLPGKCLFPESHSGTDLSSTLHQSISNETADESCAKIQVNKADTSSANTSSRSSPPVWPTDKTPRCTVISHRGDLTWCSEDMESLAEDVHQASTPKKHKLSRMSSREEMMAHVKPECTEALTCPSKRWSHTMCLSDPNTAILIGGETADQTYSKDFLWKLELDSHLWFPLSASAPGPVPTCASGHSATYDPDSKAVFVYGGLREGQRYNDLYILDTTAWKWRLVNAKGNVPTLAYHSAAFYKKELFIFGGIQASHSAREKSCSNALYIFNPEYELWYQPIVEGDRPLPRFGHSATLMLQKLVIFGGRKTATYLNDVHILDLGLMEYTAVKCGNMPPLPRGFHAALPISNGILVCGGCSALGALQDVHVFNMETSMWSSVTSSLLCSKPRAGHSILNLSRSVTTGRGNHKDKNVYCTLLVFGGSDCCGNFYNDTVKCAVEIPVM